MLDTPADLADSLETLERLLADDAFAGSQAVADERELTGAARERLARRYTLAVVGEFSSGKSYLLNALLEKARYDERGRIAGLLATDINPSTATITELRYGTPETAFAKYPSGRSERIPLDRLSRFVAVGRSDEAGALHADTTADDAAPDFVVVTVDSPFLRGGFVVADTPGLASLNPAHRRATLGYLPRADAVLYLIDTSQPFTEGDASFLGLIGDHVRTIFIVQTKIDLWRRRESDGREAWEAARDRIVERTRRFAPSAEVYAVSARDYTAGRFEGDAAAAERSGLPALLRGLDRSLADRVQRARVSRATAVAAGIARRLSARISREAALNESGSDALRAARDRALGEVAERERSIAAERDEIVRAGAARRSWIAARGSALAQRGVRALGSAIDVADIERLRDRGRFHGLVDAAVAPVWTAFAAELAEDVARELEHFARRSQLRVADLAALRLGGEPGAGAWSRDLAHGLASTVVLAATGGPAVTFVAGVAQAFAGHPRGSYMKRELGAALTATIFPAFEHEVSAFVATLAGRVGGIYADAAAALDRDRSQLRAETLEPLERALALANDGAARRAVLGRLTALAAELGAVDERLGRLAAAEAAGAAAPAAAAPLVDAAPPAAFDADAYDLGLAPQRYRVVLLGALRRGKSSLVNAVAGTRLLSDDAGTEARFPIHVRYGERARAFALERRGEWRDIAVAEAMAQSARSPVLIETPWTMPRELVLVHAPAFDSGNDAAEAIALAAARHASEVVGLFSRQLSDRELALYARVAEFGKPMLLAHTIADNESSSERRTVVELAARYVRERGLPVRRIFTISALDYFEAAQSGRPASPWNELAALRDTLHAHATEHMQRWSAKEHATAAYAATAPAAPADEAPPPADGLRRTFARLFGRAGPR